ncbi:hypothetical protein DMO16_05475 [Fictibacillus sp. S7]|nr:hypothetical protein DMO16_05475 [Fictibacillus sp. S7]
MWSMSILTNKTDHHNKKIKPPNTNGVKGFQVLIYAHVLFACPRVNLCTEHISPIFFFLKYAQIAVKSAFILFWFLKYFISF